MLREGGLQLGDASIPLPDGKVQNSLGDIFYPVFLPEHQAVALQCLLTQLLESPFVSASQAAQRDFPALLARLRDLPLTPSFIACREEAIIEALPSF